MTAGVVGPAAPPDTPAPPATEPDRPRAFHTELHPTDRVFHAVARSSGAFVMILTGSIGLFLAFKLFPTLHFYGLSFFTTQSWDVSTRKLGLAAALFGSVEIAVAALVFSFPLAICTALFITEYAPLRVRPLLVSLVDLMAAVPSIVYGLVGRSFLMPHLGGLARWLTTYFGWFPLCQVDADPTAARWNTAEFTGSAFIAGVVVSMMVTPITCSVMREVFAQAPVGEREAALALGSTRWGMIRSVVFPFGRGGIIGGTMLGLGRALGETMAVLFIITVLFRITLRPLQSGTITISALIAKDFGVATGSPLGALLATGFVLFVLTLAVNTVAGVIVSRSRSGAATEI